MARKLTEEELSKVTGGAEGNWYDGMFVRTDEPLAAKAPKEHFNIVFQTLKGEPAEDGVNTMSTPATEAEGFFQIGL